MIVWQRAGDSYDIELLKAAKAALDLPYKIVPRPLTGSTTQRVLAVGTPPPWATDHFLLSEHAAPSEWEAALAWVLQEVDEDWGATEVIDILTAEFGPGVREVTPEELAAEKKLTDYMSYAD